MVAERQTQWGGARGKRGPKNSPNGMGISRGEKWVKKKKGIAKIGCLRCEQGTKKG